jgi:hypothetical protein
MKGVHDPACWEWIGGWEGGGGGVRNDSQPFPLFSRVLKDVRDQDIVMKVPPPQVPSKCCLHAWHLVLTKLSSQIHSRLACT